MNIPEYHIRKSSRIRRLRIIIKADTIDVAAPVHCPQTVIHQFVTSNIDWIHQAQQKVQSRQRPNALGIGRIKIETGCMIPFLDQSLSLVLVASPKKTIQIHQPNTDQLHIRYPVHQGLKSLEPLILAQLIKWLKNQARTHAVQLIANHENKLGLRARSLRIKTQKSRWGSCGPLNDINLNWLLIMAPTAVFEYVVVHELCHIQHKNHSSQFWQLVETQLPDFKLQREWLKQNGTDLMQGLVC